MRKRSTVRLIAGVMLVVGSCLGLTVSAAESESQFIYVQPGKTILWPTSAGGTITLPINYPDGEIAARLVVEGTKSGELVNTTLLKSEYPTSYELSVPTASDRFDEQVLEMTLTFDSEVKKTAKVGIVRGFSNNAGRIDVDLVGLDTTAKEWTKIKDSFLVALPDDYYSFELNDWEVETGLEGKAGWYVVKFSQLPQDSRFVLTTADHEAYVFNPVKFNQGTIFRVK